MKEKINIADILKDKPVGLKFYSNTFGYISFNGVHKDKVYFFSEDTNAHSVKPNGKMYDGGECIIFPSKEMRDWEKFSWKKGDVLISDCGFMCIFKEWASDDYTKFNGCYFDGMPNTETAKYSKVDNNIAYGYIRDIENRCGGKLNLETLEIEKQTKFKDGDIVVAEEDNYYDKVIFIAAIKDDIVSKALINVRYEDYEVHYNEYRFDRNRSLRLATEEEKQQLFSALAKEGKAWDAEKKQFVDIKKEHQFKPFEKVLVRDSIDDVWRASFFSHIKENDGRYVTTCVTWKFCIPYIGNESLLGTTKDVEG
mgnify:CR=1 FL=1